MADYFTHFSCIFDVGSTEHAERALAILEELAAELDDGEGCEPGFDLERDPDHAPGALWISSDSLWRTRTRHRLRTPLRRGLRPFRPLGVHVGADLLEATSRRVRRRRAADRPRRAP